MSTGSCIGNGKTISMKAIIKECDARGYTPLYVRSFQSWMGEEGSMSAVFGKARQMAPCVIVLEDLDSLINDRNRSFFLNELDGITISYLKVYLLFPLGASRF